MCVDLELCSSVLLTPTLPLCTKCELFMSKFRVSLSPKKFRVVTDHFDLGGTISGFRINPSMVRSLCTSMPSVLLCKTLFARSWFVNKNCVGGNLNDC